MLNKSDKIMFLVLGVLIFSVACVIMYIKDPKNNDLSEISAILNTYKSEYKSETGFGNDRFDIYSFSLKKIDIEKEFKPNEKNIEMPIRNFMDLLIDESEKYDVLKTINLDIENIRKQKDVEYKYVDLGGTTKLYIYSSSLDKGYCLIFTI